MTWIYRGKPLTKKPEGYYGFVYQITDKDGKTYIGSKAFTHRRKTKLSKKARKGSRKRIEVKHVDSGWLDYFGSSKELLAEIERLQKEKGENILQTFYTKRILKLSKDRTSLRYWEAYFLFSRGVLFDKMSYNSNILGKFYKGKVSE